MLQKFKLWPPTETEKRNNFSSQILKECQIFLKRNNFVALGNKEDACLAFFVAMRKSWKSWSSTKWSLIFHQVSLHFFPCPLDDFIKSPHATTLWLHLPLSKHFISHVSCRFLKGWVGLMSSEIQTFYFCPRLQWGCIRMHLDDLDLF